MVDPHQWKRSRNRSAAIVAIRKEKCYRGCRMSVIGATRVGVNENWGGNRNVMGKNRRPIPDAIILYSHLRLSGSGFANLTLPGQQSEKPPHYTV
jgi:hypothetical protein